MHRFARDVSIQLGNASIASLHTQFLIARQFFSGANLTQLLDEIDDEIQKTDYHSFPMLGQKLPIYKAAVLTLIGDKPASQFQEPVGSEDASANHNELSFILLQIVCMTYMGFYERAKHMLKRWETESEHDLKKMISFRGAYVSFHCCLSVIGLKREKIQMQDMLEALSHGKLP